MSEYDGLKLRWVWILLVLFAFFGAALHAEFDTETLKTMQVVKVGVCDIEATPELQFLEGTYICVILVKDDDTVYTALFHKTTEDLLYVIEFKRNGEAIDTKVVWQKKIPCDGSCA